MTSPLKIYSASVVIPVAGTVLSPGAIALQADKIVAVGPPEKLLTDFPEAELIDYTSHVIMPGLVNAHADLSLTIQSFCQSPSDLPMAASPSASEPRLPNKPASLLGADPSVLQGADGRLSWARWLVELSRYKAQMDLSQQQASIQQGLSLLRRSGVTTVGDKCRYPIAVPLYRESGMRVVVMAEIENIQRRLAQEDFEQALALIDQVESEQNPLLTTGLAPFAAYTLSKNLLRILAHHAVQLQIPLHIHAGLSFSEMEFFYDSLGEISEVLFTEAGWENHLPPPHHLTPIQYLLEIGFLQATPSILGALHLGPTDSAILENRRCPLVFSPMAFRFLELGQIPWEKMIEKKAHFALATLGSAWGSSLNLWDEMRLALNAISEEKKETAAISLMHAATLGGADALHLADKTGQLNMGLQADFLVAQIDSSEKFSFRSFLENLKLEDICAVYVAGKNL